MSSKSKKYTRKVNRIPSSETPNSIFPIKPKTPSPNKNTTRKTLDKAMTILANMDYRENPEVFNLLNTNKQYKGQINRINELQLKIQNYQTEISNFEELMDENDENIDEIREKLYDNQDGSSPSQKKTMEQKMESLQNEKNNYSKQIDLREARIEETEFLIKIWQSTKINDNKKKQLEKEYIKEYRKFDNKFKAVQNKIDNLRKKTFEQKYPKIERTVFDEENHEWIFDTTKKQKIFEDFHNKRNLQMYNLSDEQQKLNDDFYRVYNSKI